MKKQILGLGFLAINLFVLAQEPIFTAGLINSNVLYTDIEDDTLYSYFPFPTYKIDINRDETIDFTLNLYFAQTAGVYKLELYIKPSNGDKIAIKNSLVCYANNIHYLVGKAFLFGDTISPDLYTFKDTAVYMAINNYITGQGSCVSNTWNNLDQKFIGVQFLEDSIPVPGWIRIGVLDYPLLTKVITYDYCLNKSYNSIAEGNLVNQNILVFPNPTSGIFKIKPTDINEKLDINILNLQGQTVYSKQNINNNDVFDISGLNNGIYILMIKSNSVCVVKKIIKQ